MQGIGVLASVLGYALLYAAYEQGFGSGGSVLYWLTGNPKLGQPSQSQPGVSSKPLAPYSAGTGSLSAGGTGLYNFTHGKDQGVPGK